MLLLLHVKALFKQQLDIKTEMNYIYSMVTTINQKLKKKKKNVTEAYVTQHG